MALKGFWLNLLVGCHCSFNLRLKGSLAESEIVRT